IWTKARSGARSRCNWLGPSRNLLPLPAGERDGVRGTGALFDFEDRNPLTRRPRVADPGSGPGQALYPSGRGEGRGSGAAAANAETEQVFTANRASSRIGVAIEASDRASRPIRVREEGSLRVRFPRATDDEVEAVIVNTAGGVAGGDAL